MGFLKAIVKAPRPFQVIESIEGKRVQTATGYSFPSGHTTGAASFYSSVAATYKKRALSILCALLILLVGLSRMYLGVHWPLDVFGGLALGITGTALLLPLFSRLYENEDLLVSFTMITGFISIFIALVLVVTMEIGVSDIVAYEDVMKLLSLLGCGYVGFSFAQSTLFYEVKAKRSLKWIRYIIGILVIAGIQGMKLILPDMLLITFFRYSIIGLWITFLFPYVGMKLSLFAKE
jgi:undecaprenyl-diphosphatase